MSKGQCHLSETISIVNNCLPFIHFNIIKKDFNLTYRNKGIMKKIIYCMNNK